MKKVLVAAAALALAGSATAADPLLINGAGATFPAPLYTKWFADYHKLHPTFAFNYQAIGSGGGIQQITAGTVDFGASDAPMKDDQIAKIPDVVHVPMVMGAVVVTYNGPMKTLKLTPEVLADVFLGKITKWNDPVIAKINPGEKLPDLAITVAHRSATTKPALRNSSPCTGGSGGAALARWIPFCSLVAPERALSA